MTRQSLPAPTTMKTWVIYKYVLQETMKLPSGAQILSIQYQKGLLVMWCRIRVETIAHLVSRHFFIVGTGRHFQATNSSLKFLTTVQENGDKLIWHIFEKL